MYIPKNIFPTVVDSSSLPMNTTVIAKSPLEVDTLNPNLWAMDSLSVILLANAPEGELKFTNASFGSDGARQLIASGFGQFGDSLNNYSCVAYRIDTLITNRILATYLNFSNAGNPKGVPPRPVGTAGGPWTTEMGLPGNILKVPRVSVLCEVQPAVLPTRNLSYAFGGNRSFNPFITSMINVDKIWSERVRASPDRVFFEWLELPQTESALFGAILMPSTKFGSANISICAVRAFWSFTSMWAMPSQKDLTPLSSFTYSFPLKWMTAASLTADDLFLCKFPLQILWACR